MPRRIDRPALTARLAAALETGSLLVAAPAGYGKTLAVAAVIEQRGGLAAWYSCRDRDADAGRLLVGLLDTIRRAVPGAADVFFEDLAGPGEAVEPVSAAASLVAELEGLLVEPLALVLDDTERIADAPEPLQVVEELLAGTGRALRVVLIGRRRPAVRLAKLAASGLVTQLDEADLAFSPEECAALLAERLGREPDDGEVAEAMARTLGWPLGLALGAGDAEDIERFLAEEVLDRIDPFARAALLASSVVEELTPASRAALGVPAELTDAAGRLGLSLSPVAGRPDAVAWHPLVRDALRARWRAERPAWERAELLHRAATALLEEGRRTEAIEAWLEAGRGPEAVAAMLPAGPQLVRAAPATLRGWLDALPEDVRTRPRTLLLAGQLELAQGGHRAAIGPLRAAAAGLRAAGAREEAGAATYALLESLYWTGRLDETEVEGDKLGDPAAYPDGAMQLAAASWWAVCRAARGDTEGARALAQRIRAQQPDEAVVELLGLIDFYIQAPAGGHDAVVAGLEAVLRARSGLLNPEYGLSLLAFLQVDVGRADVALRVGADIFAEAARAGVRPFVGVLTHLLQAWVLAQAGNLVEAEGALAGAHAVETDSWPIAYVEATYAVLASLRGDAGETRARVREALERGKAAPAAFRGLLTFSVAPALIAVGDADHAERILDELLAVHAAQLTPEGSRYHRARALAQRAAARHAEGRQDEAITDAAAAFDAAGDSAANLVRVEWERLAEPAGAALEAGALEPDTVVGLVEAAFPGGPPVLALAEHPVPAVRAATAAPVARSGHPAAGRALKALAGDAAPEVAAAARAALEGGRRRPVARRFRVLGGFALRRGDWDIDERGWGRPTVARLVRYLLVHRGAPVHEDVIAEALWPERDARSARSALQVAVSRARQVLDPPAAEQSAIRFADRAYRLVLDEPDSVDSEVFAATARVALGLPPGPRRGALERASALWSGEPLPEERYADWTTEWREELGSIYHQVLSALAQEHRAAGDEPAAAATARRLVALDPLDEGAHRLVMSAYARTGRRALALRQFLACRRALVEGLGLEPGEETVAMQHRILAGQSV